MVSTEHPDFGRRLDFRIADLTCYVAHWPLAKSVATSFGVMSTRPLLLMRITDSDGVGGWGEVWCNFPSVAAAYRARLVETVLRPLLLGRDFADPAQAFAFMTGATDILAIQSGEPGPFAQAIAGIDIAVWDMLARRAAVPLYRFLGGSERKGVPVYASGIGGDRVEEIALRKQAEGYRRFKLKVGFGRDTDLRNLKSLRGALGTETPIMVDANQAWSLDTALEMSTALSAFGPVWLEEPLRATAPLSVWKHLASSSPVPLANGENLRGRGEFEAMAASGSVRFLQPDAGKWGGITGCLEIAKFALANGVTYCPHWLGGGVGLIASLHLLAAAGGSGILEVDSNPNPFRDEFMRDFPAIADGAMAVPNGPGLGIEPKLDEIEAFGHRPDPG